MESNEHVLGEIYIMTNTVNEKVYVGQTVSHRKNHARYMPFGYTGRFKDHISEAMCNTKKHQCRYLNSAIRKYGKDAFAVKLIEVCPLDKLNERETFHIQNSNSMYPNGYNLTAGGRTLEHVKVPTEQTNPAGKRGGCVSRSLETRAKMSASLKTLFEGNESIGQLRSEKARIQHMADKTNLFKGVEIDVTQIDSYITRRKTCILVKVGDRTTRFAGKRYTPDELHSHAIEFLKSLASATLPNCSGTP
uniref:GIY-YIG domain-containing protein n=1 Tax=viral metagenome TaxID=1070528 RepID=A0A6C0EMZ9_9ZZZZ